MPYPYLVKLIIVCDRIDLSIQMETVNHVKHRHVIRLKFESTYFTSLTKPLLQVKAIICSNITENLILYCSKFLVFIIVVLHILIARSALRRNTAPLKTINFIIQL